MTNLFSTLALLCDELAATGSRLRKRAAIAEYLRSLEVSGEVSAEASGEVSALEVSGLAVDPPRDKTDAGLAALYLTGVPFPETDPRRLNVGGALLLKVIRTLTDATDAALKAANCRDAWLMWLLLACSPPSET